MVSLGTKTITSVPLVLFWVVFLYVGRSRAIYAESIHTHTHFYLLGLFTYRVALDRLGYCHENEDKHEDKHV